MFIVDSSALVAIALVEPEAPHFLSALYMGDAIYVAWPTLVETWTVIAGRSSVVKANAFIDNFIETETLLPVAFDAVHYGFARDAYQLFRLNGHPARLNYGDTMSYALARTLNLPLLFKGSDFGQTDVKIHPNSVLA
jgi:ribonuclease VapC